MAPTRQHDLDHTRSGIDPSALKELDHQVEIDDLDDDPFEVRCACFAVVNG